MRAALAFLRAEQKRLRERAQTTAQAYIEEYLKGLQLCLTRLVLK